MTDSTIRPLLATRPCACDACREVETEEIAVTPTPETAITRRAAGRPVALVGDRNTRAACGAALTGKLRARDVRVEVVTLGGDGTGVHADDRTVARVKAAIEAVDGDALPVAVGAGTINDLVKAAAHELGRRYVAVATAPSMNGYTSAIAALTVGGLKSTVPSTPPVAVLADPDVLAASPVRLAISGLADLLSKPVSSADWRMGHVLWGDPWCATPADLAGRAVAAAAAVAPGIRAGENAARATLFEALLLSGLSMALAGSSSPASGGEHLLSHFLDMTAAHDPAGSRTPALHGEQVGVATAITTRAWLTLAAHPAAPPQSTVAAPGMDEARARIAALDWLPATLRARFVEQSERKLARTGDPAARRTRIEHAWPELLGALEGDLALARSFATVLPSIDGPVDADSIGVGDAMMRTAWREARWIRDRYTVLDLVGDLGLTDALEVPAILGPAP